MENISSRFWIRVSLFNLMLVATVGALMRYKIGFEFPYFNQKHLQEAHSHFAFCGWISQTLMVLITLFIKPVLDVKRIKIYDAILFLNLCTAYLMFIFFAIQGYGLFSLIFASISIFISFAFTIFCFRDLNKSLNEHPACLWLKASLVFNVISSFGTFALALMMATKNIPQHAYLASEYWFLHFQYNGWFLFASIGIFITWLKNIIPVYEMPRSIFWLFALSCIPTYGLSVLWMKIPVWLFVIIALAAIAQFWGWIKMVTFLKNISFLKNPQVNSLSKFLFITVALAFSLKLILQLGSTVPAISKLAFGFRPIVIAYLHLILLAILSVFLITYLYSANLITRQGGLSAGIVLFFIGVFLNELVLAIQGVTSFGYYVVPFVNEILFGISLVLFSGIGIIFISQLLKLIQK